MSEEPLNVLMVEPNISYPGNTGGAVHLQEVSRELGKHVALTVVCDCEEDFEENGVSYRSVGSGRFSLFSFRKIWRLSRDADVIHSRADPFELAGPLAAKLRGIPLVGEVNVNFLAYEKKHSLRDWFYPLFHAIKYSWLKFIVRRYDTVVCVSHAIRDELLTLGFNEDNLVVAHNGGNPEKSEGLEQTAMREELELPQDDYIVLLMGELGPRHGLHKLVDTDLDEVTFLIVGGKERYKHYISEVMADADDNFLFHEPVPYEEITRFIVASDVVVAPYEESDNDHAFGFCPIKILDGMAAGKPVVASDHPWIREILSDEEGKVTNNIADGIISLQDEKTREKKGKNARERVENGLSWKHTAEKIYEVYRELVVEGAIA